ncbi:sulfite exporter TauE/SafE family protein [Gammaproteobacteria bacterium]|nr:sulfite exporter TauE/SafE family protein [Gammaproteobacteria bacterium]|tara:strand:- start:32209 stop:33000 length:792 start_codon:yes stop_codon:yes gene_type:complete
MIVEFLIFGIVGIITGTMAGLFGVGGGLIIVPVMHFILTSNGIVESIAIPLSIGTALTCIIVTSSSAAYSHYQKGSLSLKRFAQLTFGILFGAGFGSSFVINVDSEILKTMLAVFVTIMSLRLFINVQMPKAKNEPNFLFFNLSGGVIGYLSSIFGIGGGIFSVPLLKISGMEMKKAVGTGAACAFPIALLSSTSYLLLGLNVIGLPEYSIGFIYIPGVIGIVIFSFFFAKLGTKLAHKLNDNFLQYLFAAHLIPVAIYWFLK